VSTRSTDDQAAETKAGAEPVADGPTLLIEHLSWPEVDAIRGDVEVVLIPVGSNEQHGPNLSVNFDIAHSAEFCRRVSQRLYPKVLVAPAVPWGVSFHHMNFPGTITLSTSTFNQVLLEVVASLHHHGFERFLFVNGHGGNVAPLGVAVVDIQEAVGPTFVGACSIFNFQDRAEVDAKYTTSGEGGHACERETSVGMYLVPGTVKHDALAPGQMTDLTRGFRKTLSKYSVAVPYRFDQFTTDGALGDATLSSIEYGRDLSERALDNMADFIGELIAASPIE
jgi:creatinine amidohydrolase